tara:strand:+ start:20 stop:622 length:603 start_codon:yes stop_codon:yes gene_type:complete
MSNLCADNVRDSMPLFRGGSGGLIPTSALQLKIIKCKVQKACDLNELWHSRFPNIHWSNVVRNKDYVCFIAEYDNIAYASAIWSSPVAANRLKEGNTALELRRMAISEDAPKNTASRMISIMRKIIKNNLPHITLLLSYQDTDVHLGTIYKASGWYPASKSKGISWTNNLRKRNKEQSLSDKIRWEFRLKNLSITNNKTN